MCPQSQTQRAIKQQAGLIGGTNSRFFDLVVQVSGALIAPMTLCDRPRLSVWEIAVRIAMLNKIGQKLRARYEVPQDMPRDMLVLLKQLDAIGKAPRS